MKKHTENFLFRSNKINKKNAKLSSERLNLIYERYMSKLLLLLFLFLIAIIYLRIIRIFFILIYLLIVVRDKIQCILHLFTIIITLKMIVISMAMQL